MHEGPRCELHINSGLNETCNDFRCQFKDCFQQIFIFDPELEMYLCGLHADATLADFNQHGSRYRSPLPPSPPFKSRDQPSADHSGSDSDFVAPEDVDDSSEDDEMSDDEDPATATPSQASVWSRLLDGNQTDSLADSLGRTRKRRAPPSGGQGKKKVSNTNKTDPRSVTTKLRLAEFPNEPFEDVLGMLRVH